jgi:hypothetical protein
MVEGRRMDSGKMEAMRVFRWWGGSIADVLDLAMTRKKT